MFDRRNWIQRMAAVAVPVWVLRSPGWFAEELTRTPAQTDGPFYPNKLPLDTDNDLIVINNALTPAVGAITHLHGRVTDVKGVPVRNAVVEIWQVTTTVLTFTPAPATRKSEMPTSKDLAGL